MHGALLIALAIQAAPQQQISIDQLPTWRVEPTPLVVIGTNDARPGHALHRVQGATRLSDGRIVIADGGSAELRFFSTAGVLEARAGRQGRGPEEFRNIANIATGPGDTILVLTYDPTIAWVSPDARVFRKFPLDIGDFRLACSVTEGDMKQILPDASILVLAEEAFGQSGCKTRPIRLGQAQDLVGRYDPGRKRLDTLGTFQGAELEGRFYRTFGQIVVVAASPDRLFAASTGTNTIQTFSYDGERLGAWISPHEAQPVPESSRIFRQEQPERSRFRTARSSGQQLRTSQTHSPRSVACSPTEAATYGSWPTRSRPTASRPTPWYGPTATTRIRRAQNGRS